MARKRARQLQKRTPPAQSSRKDILVGNRIQLVIGALLVLGVGIYAANTLLRREAPGIILPTPIPLPSEAPLTPTKAPDSSATPSADVEKPEPSATQKANGTAQIKKLPATSGEPFGYSVETGDNLYKLGIIFCNDKKAWQTIARDNDLNQPYSLHKGDILSISCP